MDSFTAWLAGLSIVTIVIAAVVALVVAAMPFLVWGTHSRVKAMADDLVQLRADLDALQMSLDQLDIMLHEIVGDRVSLEVLSAMADVQQRRIEVLKLQAAMFESRHGFSALMLELKRAMERLRLRRAKTGKSGAA